MYIYIFFFGGGGVQVAKLVGRGFVIARATPSSFLIKIKKKIFNLAILWPLKILYGFIKIICVA